LTIEKGGEKEGRKRRKGRKKKEKKKEDFGGPKVGTSPSPPEGTI